MGWSVANRRATPAGALSGRPPAGGPSGRAERATPAGDPSGRAERERLIRASLAFTGRIRLRRLYRPLENAP
jgi:hypothetical protein